jgi:hypothetical protein
MEGNEIALTKDLNIGYTNPREEVFVMSKRSDVTATYENKDVHFEVFVTHDLDQEKIDIYKTNKIKCVHINLSDPDWLTATPEKIKDAVLNQHKNKTIIHWMDEPLPVNAEGINWAKIFWWALGALGLIYLFMKLSRRRRS